MEFGKLPDITLADFRFPSDPPGNSTLWAENPMPTSTRWYTGCTGWAMKEWVGTVYPTGTKPTDFLRQYALQFNTIELNATHYRVPDSDTIQKWKEQTPADFRFCPKILQTISHSKQLGIDNGQLRVFAAALSELEERLGPCFLQLPPYFEPSQLPVLQAFLDQWPRDLRLHIEFRHPDWFAHGGLDAHTAALLQEKHIGTVITDVAGRRDVLHLRLTTPDALVRFVGNDLHPSDYRRVGDWIQRAGTWFDKGLREMYFFTHEPDNMRAPALARYVFEKIAPTQGLQTRGPVLRNAPPAQLGLF